MLYKIITSFPKVQLRTCLILMYAIASPSKHIAIFFHFFLKESSSNNFINIGIVRKGSALDTRWVSYGMVPSGEKKSLAR